MTRADAAAGQPVAHLIEQVQQMCHLSISQRAITMIEQFTSQYSSYINLSCYL